MKYTIEYLENGARVWQRLCPFQEGMTYNWAFQEFFDITEWREKDWEAARLVAMDAKGVEHKLADWEPYSVRAERARVRQVEANIETWRKEIEGPLEAALAEKLKAQTSQLTKLRREMEREAEALLLLSKKSQEIKQGGE
jgi:hypothetical protein